MKKLFKEIAKQLQHADCIVGELIQVRAVRKNAKGK